MADDIKVKSVAEVRDNFSGFVDSLKTAAETAASSVLDGGQYEWPKPNDWNGDVTDLEGMSEPFDREEHSEDVRSAIKDATSPGTLGDLQVSTLQGDYLAIAEQMLRMRNCSPIRAAVHAAARRKGHASDSGPIVRGMKGYIENILRVAKEQK
jgi:hypothetical protein